MTIPAYIEERIRRPIPPGLHVVPNSTPVISFGDATVAHVATVGINPSGTEFRKNGVELSGRKRRLATHASLGTSDLANAPAEVVAQVLADCNGYFKQAAFWDWFGQLEYVISKSAASYLNGTACHLDLVQWATEVPWRELQSSVQTKLLDADTPFLMQQLVANPFRLLLLNGRTTIQELGKAIPLRLAGRIGSAELYEGAMGTTRVLGWTCNLQSRTTSADTQFALRERVAEFDC
jgi:hypothetical protein